MYDYHVFVLLFKEIWAKNEKDKRKSKVDLGLFRVAPVLTQGPSLLAVS